MKRSRKRPLGQQVIFLERDCQQLLTALRELVPDWKACAIDVDDQTDPTCQRRIRRLRKYKQLLQKYDDKKGA